MSPVVPAEGVNPEEIYGPAEPAEVSDLVAGVLSRRPVLTRGVLGILELGRYFYLQDGVAKGAVIPMPGFGESLVASWRRARCGSWAGRRAVPASGSTATIAMISASGSRWQGGWGCAGVRRV